MTTAQISPLSLSTIAIPRAPRLRLPRLREGADGRPPLNALLASISKAIAGVEHDPEPPPKPVVHRRPARFFD